MVDPVPLLSLWSETPLLSTDWMEYSWTLSIYTVKGTSNHIIFLIYHNISSFWSKSCCSSNLHWIITTELISYWFASDTHTHSLLVSLSLSSLILQIQLIVHQQQLPFSYGTVTHFDNLYKIFNTSRKIMHPGCYQQS